MSSMTLTDQEQRELIGACISLLAVLFAIFWRRYMANGFGGLRQIKPATAATLLLGSLGLALLAGGSALIRMIQVFI